VGFCVISERDPDWLGLHQSGGPEYVMLDFITTLDEVHTFSNIPPQEITAIATVDNDCPEVVHLVAYGSVQHHFAKALDTTTWRRQSDSSRFELWGVWQRNEGLFGNYANIGTSVNL